MVLTFKVIDFGKINLKKLPFLGLEHLGAFDTKGSFIEQSDQLLASRAFVHNLAPECSVQPSGSFSMKTQSSRQHSDT